MCNGITHSRYILIDCSDTAPPCVWLIAVYTGPIEDEHEYDEEEALIASNDFDHEEVVDADSTEDNEHESDPEDYLLKSNGVSDALDDGSMDKLVKRTQPNGIDEKKENKEWTVVQSEVSINARGASSEAAVNAHKVAQHSAADIASDILEQTRLRLSSLFSTTKK